MALNRYHERKSRFFYTGGTMKLKAVLYGGAISFISFSLAYAQTEVNNGNNLVVPPPQAQSGGADGSVAGFAGYVPSASSGMQTGGSNVTTAGPSGDGQPASAPSNLNDGRQSSPEKVEGFNAAIDQNFPMTPEMLRKYRAVFEEQQRIILERRQPNMVADSGLLTLEPGEETSNMYLAPGIATAIGVYDSTGQPWPIVQYVVGRGGEFQVIQLGQDSNNITVTPTVPVGWTNLIIVLKDEPRPINIKLEVSDTVANTRRDLQILKPGPNAVINTVSEMPTIRPVEQPETDPITREAGTPVLMAAMSGVDLPQSAKPVAISGVRAQAWSLGGRLLIRSKSPLVSPAWSNSMAGPNGVFVYEIPEVPVALFSVNGQIVRADIDMP